MVNYMLTWEENLHDKRDDFNVPIMNFPFIQQYFSYIVAEETVSLTIFPHIVVSNTHRREQDSKSQL
jgi:hypothetical protein